MSSRTWELICPGAPEEVGRARRWVLDVLRGSPRADDVALVVTELGTNALLHSSSGAPEGRFHLSLVRSAHTVLVAVTDMAETRHRPHIARAREGDTNGRGLGLVSALASRLSVQEGPGSRTVTAEFCDEERTATIAPKPSDIRGPHPS